MENFVASADFEVRVLIMSSFTVASTPNTNYGTRKLALFLNPVMPLVNSSTTSA